MTPGEDRVLSALVRRLLDDGLSTAEIAQALSLPEDEVRQARHWRPGSKFSPAERARFRDLLRYAAWRLPYWAPAPDGRLELLPESVRASRRIEQTARYPGRVAQGALPSLEGVPDADRAGRRP